MVEQNSALSYICIEPDESFYGYLERNIGRIKAAKDNLQVRAIKSLVGKGVSGVSLHGRGGTKHAVMSSGGSIRAKPLDELIADTACTNLKLLKTDVDGFDYDVLDSSAAVIRKHSPILFFELYCEFEYQKGGYERTLTWLEAEGYCDWTIFDNFGEAILRTSSRDGVIQLMQYLWNQNIGRATRTIYYFDVLAVHEKDSSLIDRVLARYR
jgi:FkbM family methyltransferase